MAERSTADVAPPSAPDLLRAALEKIVFFEWRVSELAAEVAASQSRVASAEKARGEAEDLARAAQQREAAARRQIAETEAERARLAALLARPSAPANTHALEVERERNAGLQEELEHARADIARHQSERERWLNEMVEQSRGGDDAPAALAQFISELRGEVIALRDRQKACEALLVNAGIPLPPDPRAPQPEPRSAPPAPASSDDDARRLWAEGRIGGVPETTIHAEGTAAQALAEQCLRALDSQDPARRAQAARHLAALPVPGASPRLAVALGSEDDPKARAQLARALAACGGEGAADLVARLQAPAEPPLVRLAALEALTGIASRSRGALEIAGRDPAAAVRRRAAALALANGLDDLAARLGADDDASVRAAARPREEPAAGAPPPPARPGSEDAVLAVQSALFGLTEEELAHRLGVPEADARTLVGKLIAEGRLGRRGRRLVVAGIEGGAR